MLLLLAHALALDAIEEGPWQIFECLESQAGLCTAGATIGEGYATNPGTGASWYEYAERAAAWSWAKQKIWWVTISGSATLSCPTCQKVQTSTTGTFRPKPPYVSAPGNASTLNEWHPPGRYEITSTSTSGTVKKAWYYVTAPNSDGVLTERVCAENGFKWPAKAAGSAPAWTWKIKWESDTALAACPSSGRKNQTDFSVDLSPS